MLKVSNSRCWDLKTSNSKALTSQGHLSGWLNAKSFDLDNCPQFRGLGIQKHSNRNLYDPGARAKDVKNFEFEVLGPKTSSSKVLTSWFHLSGWLEAKNSDLELPPGLEVWESKHPNRGVIPNRSFYYPGAWPHDVKNFEIEVLGSKIFEFEGFNTLESSVRLIEC